MSRVESPQRHRAHLYPGAGGTALEKHCVLNFIGMRLARLTALRPRSMEAHVAEQYSPPREADAETNSVADAAARPVPDNGIIERRRTSTSIGDIVVLTLNTHKGLSPLNRRFVLPELRDAIRAVGADIVFLQEVLCAHQRHALIIPG